MSINQTNRKKLIRSPKPLVRKISVKNLAVESEYQLKISKQFSKKQDKKLLIDLQLNKSQRSRSGSFTKRRLSFKKQIVPHLASEKQVQQNNNKHPTQQQRRVQLARAIDYSQQANYSKQNCKLKVSENRQAANGEPYRRIRRIKSNDSFLINRKKQQKNKVIEQALLKAKQQNDLLKQMHFKSLKDLKDLEQQYAEQKSTFEKEQKYFQKKIQVLRRQIQSNRMEIGHLFSYKDFDATKLNIKPIVEVEGESSIVRSLLNSSDFKQLDQISRLVPIHLRGQKEEMTQSTGPTSRQSCKEIDQL